MKSILLYFLLCLSFFLFFLCLVFNPSSPPFSPLVSDLTLPTPTSPPPKPPATVQIGLMGDLGLGRTITYIARKKNDFSYSFSGVSDWLLANDLNIANLESPIIDACPTLYTPTFTFCGDPRFLPQLSQHHFLLTLANNHILNFGPSGLTQTKDFLTKSQIPFVYSHQPDSAFTRRSINGINFGFLGFDLTGGHQFDQTEILNQVQKFDSQVDWLIVSLHWGAEYLPQAEKWRVTLARQLVDRGADIIHGHHPHVWQPPEIYQDKLIYYSLGNFIFDQNWSSATSHSNLVRLTLSQDEVIDQQTFPIEIINNSKPILIDNN